MNYKKVSYKVTWGNSHKKYFKEWQKATQFAYQKAFYYGNVFINALKYDRIF